MIMVSDIVIGRGRPHVAVPCGQQAGRSSLFQQRTRGGAPHQEEKPKPHTLPRCPRGTIWCDS